MSEKICPKCGTKVDQLLPTEAGDMCFICKDKMENPATTPAVKGAAVAERKKTSKQNKEQNRLTLWRSRVQIVRTARERFAAKDFSNAAVGYEKYIRVLEIIYEVEHNKLEVEHFNNEARLKELVVLVSAYWDLIRIYDNSPAIRSRVLEYGDKLGAFLPYTPMRMEIIRKAQDFRKKAKNKDVFDKLIKVGKRRKGRCFIATASFETTQHPTVQTLTLFRDEILEETKVGRLLISIYYIFSPTLASILDDLPSGRRIMKQTLTRLACFLDRNFHLSEKQHLR